MASFDETSGAEPLYAYWKDEFYDEVDVCHRIWRMVKHGKNGVRLSKEEAVRRMAASEKVSEMRILATLEEYQVNLDITKTEPCVYGLRKQREYLDTTRVNLRGDKMKKPKPKAFSWKKKMLERSIALLVEEKNKPETKEPIQERSFDEAVIAPGRAMHGAKAAVEGMKIGAVTTGPTPAPSSATGAGTVTRHGGDRSEEDNISSDDDASDNEIPSPARADQTGAGSASAKNIHWRKAIDALGAPLLTKANNPKYECLLCKRIFNVLCRHPCMLQGNHFPEPFYN